jgi:PPOX class probable F420-dependent enzyme
MKQAARGLSIRNAPARVEGGGPYDDAMLNADIKELAQGPNLGTVSFLLPNGHIATHVMWVDADDDHIIFNTEIHRAKFKALELNPIVTVTVIDRSNPYHYAEVRGRVTSTEAGDRGRAHIDELAQKYTGSPYAYDVESQRVIVRVTPERQRTM